MLSAEYQTGDRGSWPWSSWSTLRLLAAPVGRVLVYDRDTVGAAANLKWRLWRRLGFDVRTLVGIRPRTVTVQPELDLNFESWRVSLGGLWMDGEQYSLGSDFRRNLTAYTKVKWLF